MEILELVKSSLGINGAEQDGQITDKIEAVKAMIDLPPAIVDTALGNSLIVVGVTDIWNLNSGEIKFSAAFNIIWQKLYNNYIKAPESERNEIL